VNKPATHQHGAAASPQPGSYWPACLSLCPRPWRPPKPARPRILDNAAGTTRVGIFAGTLTSVSPTDSVNLATVDLQLPGGQITVQGILGTQSPVVHAITGGTGAYAGARGEFSFTSPSPGVLDMTLTLLAADPH